MTILVTGGSGFLGSHVVEHLARAGRPVRALVRRTSDTKFLKTLPNVELAEGAVDDAASVHAAARGVTGIVHAAGLVKAQSPDEFMRMNRGGTENLLAAALENRATLKRFVLVSSLAALRPSQGDGAADPRRLRAPPVTDYGRSKLAAERAALAKKDELSLVIVRPPAIYGPRDREILAFFKSIKLGVLPLLGSTQEQAQHDLRLRLRRCLRRGARRRRSERLRVPRRRRRGAHDGGAHPPDRSGDGTARAVAFPPAARVSSKRRRSAPSSTARRRTKAVMLTRDKLNELFEQWVCDSARARRDLGWKPEVSFETGITKTVAWYREAGWTTHVRIGQHIASRSPSGEAWNMKITLPRLVYASNSRHGLGGPSHLLSCRALCMAHGDLLSGRGFSGCGLGTSGVGEGPKRPPRRIGNRLGSNRRKNLSPSLQTEIIQKNRQFLPAVTVVPVGSAVRFPNQDNVQHHVYSFSFAKTFDIPLYIGESPQTIQFDRPGIVTLGMQYP